MLDKISLNFAQRLTRSDIRELADHFGQFEESEMIGIANDLTPHYWARSLHLVTIAILVVWTLIVIIVVFVVDVLAVFVVEKTLY